jgi:hypothetical protein
MSTNNDRTAEKGRLCCFYEVFRGEQQREWGWEYARTIKGEHYLPEAPDVGGPEQRMLLRLT